MLRPALLRVTVAIAAASVLAAAAGTASAMNSPPAVAPSASLCPPPAKPGRPVALGTAEWNGWGRDGANTRYQPEPALRATDVRKLRLKWAYALAPAASYSQPTVIGGRVFVTTSSGWVYSLAARSGCTHWALNMAVPIDTPVVFGAIGKPVLVKRRWWRSRLHNAHIPVIEPPSAVVFGDTAGNVYALDAERGTLLWKVALGARSNAAVSGAPAVFNGRVYVPLTAFGTGRGAVASLDLATGALLWRAQLPHSAAVATDGLGVSGTPTIDARRQLLYVADRAADSVVALNLADGRALWVAAVPQTPRPGGNPLPAAKPVARARAPRGNPPILQSLPDGRQVLLLANADGVNYALDPDRRGALLWQTRVLAGAGGADWSNAADHRKVYVAASDRHPRAGSQNALLAALDIATGRVLWRKPLAPKCRGPAGACEPEQAHAVTVIPGIVFSGSVDGHLRAYSTIDGLPIWDYDTGRGVRTLNSGTVRGGSLGRDGPAVVDGVVYVDAADRGAHGKAAGVLLAFSVADK